MISNPIERETLREYMRDISSPSYIDRAWIRLEKAEGDFPFDWIINLFYDDTHYAECPEDHLGKSLLDDEEVVAVRRVVVALDALQKACWGKRVSDAEYTRMPEWRAVHKAAKALHALVVANDARMAAGEGGAP